MSAVTKARTVLDFLIAEGGEATFVADEPSETHIRRQEIPRKMWNDLGNPDKITVTVEAGDMLNTTEETDDE